MLYGFVEVQMERVIKERLIQLIMGMVLLWDNRIQCNKSKEKLIQKLMFKFVFCVWKLKLLYETVSPRNAAHLIYIMRI